MSAITWKWRLSSGLATCWTRALEDGSAGGTSARGPARASVPDGGASSRTFLSSAAPRGFPAFTDNDGATATLDVTSKLQLQVWDVEALSSVQMEYWNLLVAGGVRFAHINQHSNAYAAGDSGGATGDIGVAVL